MIAAADCLEPVAGAGRATDPKPLADGGGVAAPNPLPGGETLQFAYAVPDGGADVEIGVYTVTGRRVAQLATGFAAAGDHVAAWVARDGNGRAIPPGVYFVRSLIAGTPKATRVIVLP